MKKQYTFEDLLVLKMTGDLPCLMELREIISLNTTCPYPEYKKIPGEDFAIKAKYLINTPYEDIIKDYCRIHNIKDYDIR